MSASCAFYVLLTKSTYCPFLPSRVITTFIGTMNESDSSTVFVCTHHCIGLYSLLSHVQNRPGLPGMSNITISGMPCSRTPVRFHSLALATIPCWWPNEVVDHPTQSIILTKLNHFTLSHYGVPVPCPTLNHHCLPLTLQGLGTGDLLCLTRLASHQLYIRHRTGAHLHIRILYHTFLNNTRYHM